MEDFFSNIFVQSTSNILTNVFRLHTNEITTINSDFFINMSCTLKDNQENYKIHFSFFGKTTVSYIEKFLDKTIKKLYNEFIMDDVFYEIAGIFVYSLHDKMRFSYDTFLHSLFQTKNKDIKEEVNFALRAIDKITNKDIMTIGYQHIPKEEAISSVG